MRCNCRVKETSEAFHLMLGIVLKSLTGSRKMIEIMNSLGMDIVPVTTNVKRLRRKQH